MAGHTATIPTGGVTFMDTVGSTSISLNGGSAVALNGRHGDSHRSDAGGPGTHTITANYAGVSGTFAASSNTTTLAVSKDTATVAGPVTQPVQVANGQAGSVPVSITGPYSVVALPSGSLTLYLACIFPDPAFPASGELDRVSAGGRNDLRRVCSAA